RVRSCASSPNLRGRTLGVEPSTAEISSPHDEETDYGDSPVWRGLTKPAKLAKPAVPSRHPFRGTPFRARSSAVEHCLHTAAVTSSLLVAPTIAFTASSYVVLTRRRGLGEDNPSAGEGTLKIAIGLQAEAFAPHTDRAHPVAA